MRKDVLKIEMMIQRSERTNVRNKFMESGGPCCPKNYWLARTIGMVSRPLWKVIEHAPLRVWKSYELWKQVMCMRARCQERSFHLDDLIRGKCDPLLLLRHPLYRYWYTVRRTSTGKTTDPQDLNFRKRGIFDLPEARHSLIWSCGGCYRFCTVRP